MTGLTLVLPSWKHLCVMTDPIGFNNDCRMPFTAQYLRIQITQFDPTGLQIVQSQIVMLKRPAIVAGLDEYLVKLTGL